MQNANFWKKIFFSHSASLFLFITEYYSICIQYSLFNHLPAEEYLGCFQFGALRNKAAKYCCTDAINIGVQVFV